MKELLEILAFRRMVAPALLQLLFWGTMGGVAYGTAWLFVNGNWAWWMPAVFGTLAVRVIFEGAILAFRAYERLCEIRDALERAA
jgi:hypothetical protein